MHSTPNEKAILCGIVGEITMATLSKHYGMRSTCKYCEQDIEFLGRADGWRDRGGNRQCVPYVDPKTREIVRPKTKHARLKGQ